MSYRGSELDLTKITTEDFIYLAGLIDGDGCFFISKRTTPTANGEPSYMMKLQVHCINEFFIDDLHELFGGVKVVCKRKAPRNTLYGVEFTGKLLTRLCEMILPFLRLKQAHCQNMLDMRNTYNGIGGRIQIPPEIIAYRNLCFEMSRAINTHKPLSALPPCCPSALSSEEVQVN